MHAAASIAVHMDVSADAASPDTMLDAASTAVHRDAVDQASSSDAMIGIAGISLAEASTAVFKDPTAADPSSSPDTMIGIAGDALHPNQHAAAAANPYMACDHEETFLACVHEGPNPVHYARSRKTKMILAAVAAMIIMAGLALGLGLGLHFGLNKSECALCVGEVK